MEEASKHMVRSAQKGSGSWGLPVIDVRVAGQPTKPSQPVRGSQAAPRRVMTIVEIWDHGVKSGCINLALLECAS